MQDQYVGTKFHFLGEIALGLGLTCTWPVTSPKVSFDNEQNKMATYCLLKISN